jgi:hypothetical protein
MINLYVLIISTGILTFAIERVMRIFFEKRKTSFPVIVLSYLIFWAVLVTQHLLPSMTLYVYMVILAGIIVSLNYEASMIKRFIALSGCYVILILCTAIYHLFMYVLPYDLFIGVREVAFISAIIITFLLVLLVFQRFTFIRKNMLYSTKLLLPICFVSIVDLVSTSLWSLNIPNAMEIYYTIILIGVAFIIFYLHNSLSKSVDDNVKSALYAKEKEYYFAQCQLMQESLEHTKSIHHDMKLHLATARDFIANNEPDKATNYLDGLLGDVDKSVIHSNTKNTAFDSIINYKLRNAEQENIKLDLRLLIPPTLNIEVSDIVIIIGNLLDNALDAVSKVEEKFIKLDIEYSRESLFVQVENTFDGVVKYAEGAAEKSEHIITQKIGGEHGCGLKNIRKSVEKYNGHFEVSHEEKIFSATVLLYVDTM